jgi:hypothetical protein
VSDQLLSEVWVIRPSLEPDSPDLVVSDRRSRDECPGDLRARGDFEALDRSERRRSGRDPRRRIVRMPGILDESRAMIVQRFGAGMQGSRAQELTRFQLIDRRGD